MHALVPADISYELPVVRVAPEPFHRFAVAREFGIELVAEHARFIPVVVPFRQAHRAPFVPSRHENERRRSLQCQVPLLLKIRSQRQLRKTRIVCAAMPAPPHRTRRAHRTLSSRTGILRHRDGHHLVLPVRTPVDMLRIDLQPWPSASLRVFSVVADKRTSKREEFAYPPGIFVLRAPGAEHPCSLARDAIPVRLPVEVFLCGSQGPPANG